MSTAQLGASLLAEVTEVSLDKLLAELRKAIGHETIPLTGLLEIDQLLQVFLQREQPADSFISESSHTLGGRDIDSDVRPSRNLLGESTSRISSPKPKPALIEVSSSTAGSEQIELCYWLTTASVLSPNCGGSGGCVVWLDADLRFSVSNLYQLCLEHLFSTNKELKPQEREHEARQALDHVHVFSVQSSKQLLSILDNLDGYLLAKSTIGNGNGNEQMATSETPPDHNSLHRQLSLIVLDSATAFNWPDRFDGEIARLENLNTLLNTNRSATETTAVKALSKLNELQELFGCAVIYTTNHSMTQIPHASKQPPQRHVSLHHTPIADPSIEIPHESEAEQNQRPPPPLPPPPPQIQTQTLSSWQTQATLSLHLTSIPTPQFQTNQMTLQDCLRDQARRQEIVSQRRTHISINEDWLVRFLSADVKENIANNSRESELKKRVTQLRKDGKLDGFVVNFGTLFGRRHPSSI